MSKVKRGNTAGVRDAVNFASSCVGDEHSDSHHEVQPLADISLKLEKALTSTHVSATALFSLDAINRVTALVPMRDGVLLATDLYLPPISRAPAIAMRTPYGRRNPKMLEALLAIAQRGYVVISQDCRGTGDSEPASWDYYVHESEDSYDFVEWVATHEWFDGFLGALGSSYIAQVQWCMSMHPATSAIVPEVSGLGLAVNTARLHMFINAYARSVGKGREKTAITHNDLEREMLIETLTSGYFNEPLHQPFSEELILHLPQLKAMPPTKAKRWLWEHYCTLPCNERAALIKAALRVSTITISEIESLSSLFGVHVAHDSHMLPYSDQQDLCHSFHAPALMITGWYDWGLNDALATWELLTDHAAEPVRSQSRLIITPSAHNKPGYHEGKELHPELQHNHRNQNHIDLLLLWYEAIRARAAKEWPQVIYYLLGENRWVTASHWPPAQARAGKLYLHPDGRLDAREPQNFSPPDEYSYDPTNPPPTLGGSIVSSVYTPGSVDVRPVQQRPDVLVYTTAPLANDVDVVGYLRFVLYASSSAVDTDFCIRLSDVFPDGRAIQLQNGILRARYRNRTIEPQLLEPGRIYRFEIDMWAIANRFRVGHRLRIDVSSADFPRFDRNMNRGGQPGRPEVARQSIYHDRKHPSHLVLSVIGRSIP